MKARPILFSGPMIRALLDGTKMQTRRIVKLPSDVECRNVQYYAPPSGRSEPGWAASGVNYHAYDKADPHHMIGNRIDPCPYGQRGDLLWVRESFSERGRWIRAEFGETGEIESCWGGRGVYRFSADGKGTELGDGDHWRSFPSIHMPRRISRLTLEITDVRVERLQDISEEDAKAEGVTFRPGLTNNRRHAFANLWAEINGAESWLANPWVWAIGFRIHRQNIDDFLTTRAAKPN